MTSVSAAMIGGVMTDAEAEVQKWTKHYMELADWTGVRDREACARVMAAEKVAKSMTVEEMTSFLGISAFVGQQLDREAKRYLTKLVASFLRLRPAGAPVPA